MDIINDLLTRGVENIIPDKIKLSKLLESDKLLNIYLGIDPTATEIHIGHAVPLRKLQKFAEMGHNVTFLIGDFTALIGDTSDKDSERPVLTSEQIEHNFQTYKQQAEKILDFTKIKVIHNSQWLSKLTFQDIVKLTQNFSAGDFYSRELIKKRLNDGKYVGLHEILYPVMQGYDSYFMDTDIQLGGTDQTFNMQAGRILQKKLRNKESYIIANSFLTGTDGRKMSKTWNNAIWINDKPADMYGKIMSLKDDLIIEYFTLATDLTFTQIDEINGRLKNGENPMTVKKELAREIVRGLHNRESADLAQSEFENKFQKQNFSDLNINVYETAKTNDNPIDVLVESGAVKSKSEAKRLISEKAIDWGDSILTLQDHKKELKDGMIIKVGKRIFVRILIRKH